MVGSVPGVSVITFFKRKLYMKSKKKTHAAYIISCHGNGVRFQWCKQFFSKWHEMSKNESKIILPTLLLPWGGQQVLVV